MHYNDITELQVITIKYAMHDRVIDNNNNNNRNNSNSNNTGNEIIKQEWMP